MSELETASMVRLSFFSATGQGDAITYREDVLVCRSQVLVGIDSIPNVIVHSSFLKTKPDHVGLASCREEDCINFHFFCLLPLLDDEFDQR